GDYPRDIQQIVYQPRLESGIALDRFKALQQERSIVQTMAKKFRPAQDRSERSAQFMRESGKEDILGLIGSLQVFVNALEFRRSLADSEFEIAIQALQIFPRLHFGVYQPSMFDASLDRKLQILDHAGLDEIIVGAMPYCGYRRLHRRKTGQNDGDREGRRTTQLCQNRETVGDFHVQIRQHQVILRLTDTGYGVFSTQHCLYGVSLQPQNFADCYCD